MPAHTHTFGVQWLGSHDAGTQCGLSIAYWLTISKLSIAVILACLAQCFQNAGPWHCRHDLVSACYSQLLEREKSALYSWSLTFHYPPMTWAEGHSTEWNKALVPGKYINSQEAQCAKERSKSPYTLGCQGRIWRARNYDEGLRRSKHEANG